MPDYANYFKPQTGTRKGQPPNPLTGGQMGSIFPLSRAGQPQPPPETYRPPQLENPGITNTAGMASKGQPEIMTVPAPVSATDPAFSMHPILKALSTTPGMSLGTTYPSTWMQLPQKSINRSHLLSALGLPGMAGSRTETQGQSY